MTVAREIRRFGRRSYSPHTGARTSIRTMWPGEKSCGTPPGWLAMAGNGDREDLPPHPIVSFVLLRDYSGLHRTLVSRGGRQRGGGGVGSGHSLSQKPDENSQLPGPRDVARARSAGRGGRRKSTPPGLWLNDPIRVDWLADILPSSEVFLEA